MCFTLWDEAEEPGQSFWPIFYVSWIIFSREIVCLLSRLKIPLHVLSRDFFAALHYWFERYEKSRYLYSRTLWCKKDKKQAEERHLILFFILGTFWLATDLLETYVQIVLYSTDKQKNHNVIEAWRDQQGSSSPTPDSTEVYPKIQVM